MECVIMDGWMGYSCELSCSVAMGGWGERPLLSCLEGFVLDKEGVECWVC